MTTHKPSLRRARVALLSVAALALVLSACQYRPEKGVSHAGDPKPTAGSTGHGSSPKPGASLPEVCPTEEGLTPCGVDTNPPPKATGDYALTTLAGGGSRTYADGTGDKAGFVQPAGLALDAKGNVIVADSGAHRIRQVTPKGVVTTIAGSSNEAGYADGPVASAKFSSPRGVAVGADGTIYVADTGNHVIRVISGGKVSTLAGTAGKKGLKNAPGKGALLFSPIGIALAKDGSLYVTEFDNHLVRLVSKTGSIVRVFAGTGKKGYKDGAAAEAQFDSPVGVVVAADGAVFVADAANNKVRKVAGGKVSTFAGSTAAFKDGTGTKAAFNIPYGMTMDKAGTIFLTEFANNSIRSIDPKGAVKTVIVPPNRPAEASPSPSRSKNAPLQLPSGIVWSNGKLYVSDSGHAQIRVAARG